MSCSLYRKENDRQGICFGNPPTPALMPNPRMQNGPPIIQGFRPPVGAFDTCALHPARKEIAPWNRLPPIGLTGHD